jgi:hypothetical protein
MSGSIQRNPHVWLVVIAGIVAGLTAWRFTAGPPEPAYKAISLSQLGLSGRHFGPAIDDVRWLGSRWDGQRVSISGTVMPDRSFRAAGEQLRIVPDVPNDWIANYTGVFCKGGEADLLRWDRVHVSGVLRMREQQSPRMHTYEIEVHHVRSLDQFATVASTASTPPPYHAS